MPHRVDREGGSRERRPKFRESQPTHVRLSRLGPRHVQVVLGVIWRPPAMLERRQQKPSHLSSQLGTFWRRECHRPCCAFPRIQRRSPLRVAGPCHHREPRHCTSCPGQPHRARHPSCRLGCRARGRPLATLHDLAECRAVLFKVHGLGISYGWLERQSFVIVQDGPNGKPRALIQDFRNVTLTSDESTLADEMQKVASILAKAELKAASA